MGTHYNTKIVTSDLVATYDFKNRRCYDGSGSTAYNLINRNDKLASFTNATGNGDYVSFDDSSSSSFLNITNPYVADTTAGLSIGMWIKIPLSQSQPGSGGWNYFLRHWYGTNVYEIGNYGANGGGSFQIKDNGLNYNVQLDMDYSTHWTYLVIGFENRYPFIWAQNQGYSTRQEANGGAQYSAATSWGLTGFFGNFSQTGLTCDLASMQIYSRKITREEFDMNYNAYRSRYGEY